MDPIRIVAGARFHRSAVLLAGLVLFIFLDPLIDAPVAQLTLELSILATLVLAVWALRVRGWKLVAVVALALLTLALLIANRSMSTAITAPTLAVVALFLAVVTAALLSYVLNMSRVTVDKIFAAVAAFLLLAILFATLFALLLHAQPGALQLPGGAPVEWFDVVYFSVTVLTTTGFGDVVPLTRQARALVMIEQIVGVMYVAFLVARLANLYPRRED
jgi:drug/metabolite transporter (DMT)-like permease